MHRRLANIYEERQAVPPTWLEAIILDDDPDVLTPDMSFAIERGSERLSDLPTGLIFID